MHSGQYPPLLAEQGPRLVAGVGTMDDSPFTIKIKIHNGPAAVQLGCVALWIRARRIPLPPPTRWRALKGRVLPLTSANDTPHRDPGGDLEIPPLYRAPQQYA